MSGFLINKRKTFELLALLILDLIFYLLWDNWDFVMMFSLGYIWNWVATQESSIVVPSTRKYRFSTLKTVFNLQNLFLKPVARFPEPVKLIVRSLPAGIFWSLVIIFNESTLPWWAVFIGSLTIELVQFEKKLFQPKETSL